MNMGFLGRQDYTDQIELLKSAELPVKLPFKIDGDFALKLLSRDKISHSGEINLVLLKNIGNFFVQKNIDSKIIRNTISSFNRN